MDKQDNNLIIHLIPETPVEVTMLYLLGDTMRIAEGRLERHKWIGSLDNGEPDHDTELQLRFESDE